MVISGDASIDIINWTIIYWISIMCQTFSFIDSEAQQWSMHSKSLPLQKLHLSDNWVAFRTSYSSLTPQHDVKLPELELNRQGNKSLCTWTRRMDCDKNDTTLADIWQLSCFRKSSYQKSNQIIIHWIPEFVSWGLYLLLIRDTIVLENCMNKTFLLDTNMTLVVVWSFIEHIQQTQCTM